MIFRRNNLLAVRVSAMLLKLFTRLAFTDYAFEPRDDGGLARSERVERVGEYHHDPRSRRGAGVGIAQALASGGVEERHLPHRVAIG